MADSETFATFRLFGDLLDVSEVTRRLGLEPDAAYHEGEPNPAWRQPHASKTGVWEFTSKGRIESPHLEEHLVYLIEKVEPVKQDLHDLVARQALRPDFWCFVETYLNTEHWLSPDTLRRIADLRAHVGLDIYAIERRARWRAFVDGVLSLGLFRVGHDPRA
jgi:uncharacterized protein DUF4279